MIDAAHEKIRRCVSRTLVGRAHKRWVDAKKAATAEEERRVKRKAAQTEPASTLCHGVPVVVARERRASPAKAAEAMRDETQRCEPETSRKEPASVASGSGQPVQHLGTWLMVATIHALGVYRIAEVQRERGEKELAGTGKQCLRAVTLRLAITAVVIALSLGQQTVEGSPCHSLPTASATNTQEGATVGRLDEKGFG
jgi:hypothetical protein